MSIGRSLKYILLELKELGFAGSLYRLLHESLLRSGIYQKWEIYNSRQYRKWLTPISFKEWKKNKNNFFADGISSTISDFLINISDQEKSFVIQVADHSLQGNIFCFSNWFADYGDPINWHLNPVKKIQWPKDLHWSKAMKFYGGDVKLVWEVNRFPQVYFLVRAFNLTKDPKYIRGFVHQISNWAEQNPYLLGVNWASGQELAIRVLSWIFGLYNFYQSEEFSEEDFDSLIRLIYLHAYHINNNIHYAYYAVHNNHLIGEALALYTVGTLFPFMPHAEKWKLKGKQLLLNKCPEQFYEDGGYCQLSHNYHRLALHYYLWAVRIGELNDDKFSEKVYNIFKKSAEYLYQNMNISDGRLPNWGSNDGGLLNPWNCCDYTDFRPLLAAIYRVCGEASPFPTGNWDEESLWFLGEVISEKQKDSIQETQSFLPSGLHILRQSTNDFCVLRCGTPVDRFGQADQLHVDIFFDGKNIAVDGGSYLYNDEIRFHEYFMGTRSHNTVVVDQQDQMFLWRRFKWLYKSMAKLIQFDRKNKIVTGEHYGYFRIEKGLIHNRTVQMDEDKIVIKDQLSSPGHNKHEYNLHWNLDVDNMHQMESGEIKTFELKKDNKNYWMYILLEGKSESEQVTIDNGYDDGSAVNGWMSRFYGGLKDIYTLDYITCCDSSVCINTIISKVELYVDEIKECISC